MAKSRSQCVFIFRAGDGIFMIRESCMRSVARRGLKREDRDLPNGLGLAKFAELSEFFSLPFSENQTTRLPGIDVKEPGVFVNYKILTLRPFLCEVPGLALANRAVQQGCLQPLQAHPLCQQIPIPPALERASARGVAQTV